MLWIVVDRLGIFVEIEAGKAARALLQNMVSPPEAQVRDAATLVNRSWADLGLGEVGGLLIR